ncbi:MAG: hypothetical protein GZ094_12155 [Mariniphaga sp.]|nr:hypothetical protein [Mariniphaga sp.]
MEQLIKDIFQIIKDYREDEGMMSMERIKTWIEQFNGENGKEYRRVDIKYEFHNVAKVDLNTFIKS